MSGTGAIPLASFKLLRGLCTNAGAGRCQQVDLLAVDPDTMGGDQPAIHETEVHQVANRRATIEAPDVEILVLGLSQMRDDEDVEPLGERMHAAVKIRTYGVGRMWSQRRYNAGVIAPTRGKLFGLGQGSIGTGRASDVEVGVRQNPAHP